MNNQSNRAERAKSAATAILIAAFAVIVLGTLAIPAVLTFLYGWKWLLVYPVCLAVILIYAARGSKKNRS